jgi:hypothetical protein
LAQLEERCGGAVSDPALAAPIEFCRGSSSGVRYGQLRSQWYYRSCEKPPEILAQLENLRQTAEQHMKRALDLWQAAGPTACFDYPFALFNYAEMYWANRCTIAEPAQRREALQKTAELARAAQAQFEARRLKHPAVIVPLLGFLIKILEELDPQGHDRQLLV